MKKKTIIIISSVVLVAAVGAAVYYLLNNEEDWSKYGWHSDPDSNPGLYGDYIPPETKPAQITWEEVRWQGPDFTQSQLFHALDWYNDVRNRGDFPWNLNEFIHATLPHYYNMMPHTKYSSQEVVFPDEHIDFLNNLFGFVGRNNDMILGLYKQMRPVIFRLADQEDYIRWNIIQYVTLLSEVRPLFIDHELEKWNNIFLYEMYKDLNEHYSTSMKYIESFLEGFDIEVAHKYNSEDTDYMEAQIYWAYSFWPRRFRENNIQAASHIIDDLAEYFIHGRSEGLERFPADVLTGERQERDDEGNYIYHLRYGKNWDVFTYRYDDRFRRTGEWTWNDIMAESNWTWEMSEGVANGLFEGRTHRTYDRYNYIDGSIEGEAERSYKKYNSDERRDFTILEYSHWKHNKLDGQHKAVDEDGNTTLICNYSEGILEGDYTEYYPSGQVKVQGVYEAGKLEGDYREYYVSGEIKLQRWYEAGTLKKNAHYLENGELSSSFGFEESELLIPQGGTEEE